MKIIDGKGMVMGRLASYVAKQAMQGEEIAVVNCSNIIITGNKKFIKEKFEESRRRVGTRQIGPKVSKSSEKIFKRAIRGMLSDHRRGRGKDAWRRIKCYSTIPKGLNSAEIIQLKKSNKIKSIEVKEINE